MSHGLRGNCRALCPVDRDHWSENGSSMPADCIVWNREQRNWLLLQVLVIEPGGYLGAFCFGDLGQVAEWHGARDDGGLIDTLGVLA